MTFLVKLTGEIFTKALNKGQGSINILTGAHMTVNGSRIKDMAKDKLSQKRKYIEVNG